MTLIAVAAPSAPGGTLTLAFFIFTVAPYLAAALFIVGLARRVTAWRRSAVPLKNFLAPAPDSRPGAYGRLARRAVFLDRPAPGGWVRRAIAIGFHVALALVLLGHLRYFLDPAPGWVMGLQTAARYSGWVLAATTVLVLYRRVWLAGPAHASGLGDLLLLLVILAVAVSGLMLRGPFRIDLVPVKTMILGLVSFSPAPAPIDPLLAVHVLGASALLALFPFTSLAHGLGLFWSPVLGQRDDLLWERHVNPWDNDGAENGDAG